jgi:hypothetical protein
VADKKKFNCEMEMVFKIRLKRREEKLARFINYKT